MDDTTASLSSSLAISVLRNATSPYASFVFAPVSLNSALSAVHDGASGKTQKELTNLLLNGRSPSDVTEYYSSLVLSLPSTDTNGVVVNSSNQFYIDHSISLKNDYQKHIESKYKFNVSQINLGNKAEASKEISEFVEGATKGKIKKALAASEMTDCAQAYLITTINLLGKWRLPFEKTDTESSPFESHQGPIMMDFMNQCSYFLANRENPIGTFLAMSLLNEDEDHDYNFFYLMPNKSSNLEEMRNELTGDVFLDILKSSKEEHLQISVPKFKVESELDGIEILHKLGVVSLLKDDADLSKVSSKPLRLAKILHNAVIQTDEFGTDAAASSLVEFLEMSSRHEPPSVTFDRPFLFGILKNDDILFLGQFA